MTFKLYVRWRISVFASEMKTPHDWYNHLTHGETFQTRPHRLRVRQYALLLASWRYSQHLADPEVVEIDARVDRLQSLDRDAKLAGDCKCNIPSLDRVCSRAVEFCAAVRDVEDLATLQVVNIDIRIGCSKGLNWDVESASNVGGIVAGLNYMSPHIGRSL